MFFVDNFGRLCFILPEIRKFFIRVWRDFQGISAGLTEPDIPEPPCPFGEGIIERREESPGHAVPGSSRKDELNEVDARLPGQLHQ